MRVSFYRAWLAVLIAACTLPPAAVPAQEQTPYELNGVFPTTGAAAFAGIAAGNGFKALEPYINATGGIHGRPVHMTVLDDQSNPQVTVQLVNALIAKKAAVIMGPMATASCNAVMTLVAQGPVAYCVSTAVTLPTGSYMFKQGGSPTDCAVVTLRYLQERGVHRVAMLNSTDATGQSYGEATERAFSFPEFKSMQLVALQHFAPSDTSVTAQLSIIKAANAQAIITWNLGSAFGTVLHGVRDSGMDALPVIGSGANANESQARALTGFRLDDVHFVASPSFVGDARVSQEVLAQQALFRKIMSAAGYPADGTYAAAFDITMIEITALRSLPPNPSADEVRTAISHISHYVGANGIYDFRFGNQSGAGQAIFLLVHWDAAKGRFISSSTPAGHLLARRQ